MNMREYGNGVENKMRRTMDECGQLSKLTPQYVYSARISGITDKHEHCRVSAFAV